MPGALSSDQIRRIYDRWGRGQDLLGFYEQHAMRRLIENADFESARTVFEFGCGTGRLAANLLEHHLPETARYVAVDLSPRMVELARSRTATWSARVDIQVSEGPTFSEQKPCSYDRFVSTFVLDLLDAPFARTVVDNAHRMLSAGGRLCLTSLCSGETPATRAASRIWDKLYSVSPKLMGGCRPVELRSYVPEDEWRLDHFEIVARFGMSSSVLVATRLSPE